MHIAFFAKKPGPKLVVVSPECRTAVFVEHNVPIPSENRCCPAHIKDGRFKCEAICQLPTTEHTLVNTTAIIALLQQMGALCRRNDKSHLDFDDSHSLTDTEHKTLLGLSKDNFHTVCDNVKDHVKETPSRSLQKSVAIFLC